MVHIVSLESKEQNTIADTCIRYWQKKKKKINEKHSPSYNQHFKIAKAQNYLYKTRVVQSHN